MSLLKVRLTSAVLAMMALSPAVACAANESSADPVNITAMHLVQRNTGWVQSGSHVYWTKTNGQSWSDITPAINKSQEIQSVLFLDESHGWIALDDLSDVASSPFSIASTTNGGKSWQYATPDFYGSPLLPELKAVSISVRSIAFTDPQHGWVMYRLPTSTLQNVGILFRTIDGGAHWTLLSAPMAGDLAFTSDSVGVVYGEQPNSDEVPTQAWYTTDAGSHWKQAELPLPSQCSVGGCVLSDLGPAHFESSQEVLLAAVVRLPNYDYVSFTYRSETGGRSWTIDETSLARGKDEYLQPTLFYEGQQYRIYQRTIGSVTLQAGSFSTEIKLPADTPSLSGGNAISFLDPTTGWMLVNGMSCAVGFHAPCIRPDQQATHQELISVLGNSLQTITPLRSTITPNTARSTHPLAGNGPAGDESPVSIK